MVALLLSLTEWLVPMPLALQPFTGADGVKVPLVTEAEKAQRRANRRKRGPKARRRRKRMPRGSDQPYKKFKRVAFYDPSKEHQSPHAEGLMVLAAVRSSGLWTQYWTQQRLDAA
jgi:hypothetical protein